MFDRVPHNVIYRDDIVYGAKKLITFHKFMTLTKKNFFVPLVFFPTEHRKCIISDFVYRISISLTRT